MLHHRGQGGVGAVSVPTHFMRVSGPLYSSERAETAQITKVQLDTMTARVNFRPGLPTPPEGARQGHPGAPTNRGRSNTDTQNAGATPGGTRASTADKEEGHSKAGEASRTAGTGNQNGADGRVCAWEAATIKGMAWPASPVATGCQGNPCSTGIRWGASPAAQMGCLRNRCGSPSGADQP